MNEPTPPAPGECPGPEAHEDEKRLCIECGGEFFFTANGQHFMLCERGLSPPKRCQPCRQERRRAAANTERSEQ